MKTVKIATHSGTFHSDEVFALAVLKLSFEKAGKQVEIVRTRDLEIISSSDVVVDVGEVYNHSKKRYDHHQKARLEKRDNGIPYASLGLIWKHYGKKLSPNKKVLSTIEQKLVMPIDALDNGIAVSNSIFEGVKEYTNFQVLQAINSAFGEGKETEAFEKCLELACLVIVGEIKKAEAKIVNEEKVNQEIIKQGHPEVLVLEKYLTWEVPVSKSKNIKLVIFPDGFSTNWCIQTARDNLDVFGSDRTSFPPDWRGLSSSLLAEVTGIPGAIFCHMGGFYAVVSSKSGAMEMANKVISFKV